MKFAICTSSINALCESLLRMQFYLKAVRLIMFAVFKMKTNFAQFPKNFWYL